MDTQNEKSNDELKYEKIAWGSSLPVPSVQELVRNDAKEVPKRYIQNNENRPITNFKPSQESAEIPIINFSLLADGNEDERKKMHLACKEWGFFQLLNHGITKEVMQNVKKAVSRFFELPLIEKKKYAMEKDDLHGYGQAFVHSEEQTLEWSDIMFLIIYPLKSRKTMVWPELPGFKEAVEEYSSNLERVRDEILENISLLLGLERKTLKEMHGEMKHAVRMNYYPPCPNPDLVLGIGPHSDATSITLLLQDDDITGLHINHNKTWIPVHPIPNAILVNVGDCIEIWSNGMYKSIEHRAVTNKDKVRVSIATNVFPADTRELEPIKTMIYEQRPSMYKRVKFLDLIRYGMSKTMDGKIFIEFAKEEDNQGP
ncbi:codeine O-demethylase-like [Lycium ferocissimum]|uniref:codeine O-demethylase-like n=1 Tax=Lycium ferocissimum TaxID=112874 RepID=UPI002815328D|nr:codeine O-demethylase-like [Lycium ferocissimum]